VQDVPPVDGEAGEGMTQALERWWDGKPMSKAEMAEACETEAELDNFLNGYALTKREPPLDVIEAVARRRAVLRARRA
jgi:hypothetical protein